MSTSDYERDLLYFHRTVLCHYRVSPDLYSVAGDDMGGVLQTRYDAQESEGATPARPFFRVRFGFRRLNDNRVCIAAFAPDVRKLPEQDRLIWRGHLTETPVFSESDPAFYRWVQRHMEGSWEVEDGPRVQIERLVKLIRALTSQTLGTPLWRLEENPLINYPIAENTDAYAKAHLELYRLLVEGVCSKAVQLLSNRLEVTLTDPSKTLNSLKKLLPPALREKIHTPLSKCSKERNKLHEPPDRPVTSFAAFDSFQRDLLDIETGLRALNDWLQEILCADSEACLRREKAMATLFPKIVGPPRPEHKLAQLQQAQGKTVGTVEFGEVEENADVHQSEAIVLHFTDGSSMCISVGSNAKNLSLQFDGLEPQDVHTDLMVFWAPAIGRGSHPAAEDPSPGTP